MAVLVLNCGSSSVKFALYGAGEEDVLLAGTEERVSDHRAALEGVVGRVASSLEGGLSALDAVGHRVVHGGRRFQTPRLVDAEVLEAIRAYADLAPLHNPHNLRGIEFVAGRMPGLPQVAVFDTSFHATIPPHAHNYALPMDLARRHRIRRYGFHGISHQYVHDRAIRLLGRGPQGVSAVTCHLGNGASVAAIRDGRCQDTSMGFSPLEGLVMGTRCGDLDPSVVHYLLSPSGAGMSEEEVHRLLNRESGLKGLSGLSGDVRDLLRARGEGHEGAALALSVFAYRLKKYISAYLGVLGVADVLVFTAGIGENSPDVRAEALAGLEPLGIALDPARNLGAVGVEAEVTGEGSRTRILVVPTDEDRMIYREVARILGRGKAETGA